MKATLIIIINLAFLLFVDAQSRLGNIKELKVGDTIPRIVLNNLNDPKSPIDLLSFKGKYILLDFWSTYCSACIEGFPKLDSIQPLLKDSLQIVLVNAYENKDVQKRFFSRREKVVGHRIKNLSIGIGDSSLNYLFKHYGVPFYVVIDKKGIIKAFPQPEQLSFNNLNAIIHSEKNNVATKVWTPIDLDPLRPIFVNGNGGDGNEIIWYSMLANNKEGFRATQAICPKDENNRAYAYFLNYPAIDLFQNAFYDGFKTNDEFWKAYYSGASNAQITDSRTVLRVKDSTKYVRTINHEFTQHKYAYQLLGPGTDYLTLQKKMQEDLRCAFNLNVFFEKQYRNCIVFSCKDTTSIHTTENKVQKSNFGKLGIDFVNVPFNTFIFDITYGTKLYYSPYVIIDETGIKGNVDMKFDANMDDWKSIAQAISKYKIDVSVERRLVDVLVISDQN